MASVVHVGDSCVIFGPPGLQITALAGGVPSTGLLVIPAPISGFVQKGSAKITSGGRGVAHIGDPVMVPMPPTLAITGSIVGTLTFPLPLSGVIELGSSKVKSETRGLARAGDTVIVCFPPTLVFEGTVAGQPYAGPLQILNPARGYVRSSSGFYVS